MKYSELVYERPDFEKVAADIADATARLKKELGLPEYSLYDSGIMPENNKC